MEANSVERGRMNFAQIDKYFERSDCGRYTVCRIGGARGWMYESWFGKEQLAVGFMAKEPAEDHCRWHQSQTTQLNAA